MHPQYKLASTGLSAKLDKENFVLLAQFGQGLFAPKDFQTAFPQIVKELGAFTKGLSKMEGLGFFDFHYAEKPQKIILAVLPADLDKLSKTDPFLPLGGKLGKACLGWKKKTWQLLYPDTAEFLNGAESLLEGLLLGIYNPAIYKKNPEDALEKLSIFTKSNLRPAFERALAVQKAVFLTRDCGNQGSNDFKPVNFHEQSSALAKRHKFSYQHFDKKALEKMKFGCFMCVARGSDEEAYLSVLEYNGGTKDAAPVLLVGKGITFDTGGYSLKPAASMEEMKFDMCGGAAVLGAMELVGALKPKTNVVAIIPTCENMISGHATKPGDVVTAYNGLTVEITNTDAEGRLILADALAYGIEKYKPQVVIDLATLTGACVVALGKHHTGLFSNNEVLASQLTALSKIVQESLWPLPLDEAYADDMKGTYSDLKNSGARWAGATTAAKFLENFVGDVPWAHFDIAGTAWDVDAHPLYPKFGATGVGVRLLYQYIAGFEPLKNKLEAKKSLPIPPKSMKTKI